MVMTAMVFIDELSRLLAVAMLILAAASSCVRSAKSYSHWVSAARSLNEDSMC
jgi:hypothetical protein